MDINEMESEIRRLQHEVKRLKGSSLRCLVTERPLGGLTSGGRINSRMWSALRGIAAHLYPDKTASQLLGTDKQMMADMINEIIRVYNKYYEKVNG